MRKIRKSIYMNAKTFEPHLQIIMKDDQGNVTTLLDAELTLAKGARPGYTAEDIQLINDTNDLLTSKNMAIMTEDEERYLIDPYGERFGPKKDIKPEELQRLAGFEVTKTVKYYDDLKEKNND